MRDIESLDRYFLYIINLCSRFNVDHWALIHYMINGSAFEKPVLYGCSNILEFKQKVTMYEILIFDYDMLKQ